MSFSRLVCSLVESPTVSINEKARLLREEGKPVIHLGIGETKNPTPSQAVAAMQAHLSHVKYTPVEGTPTLRQAILQYTEENYGREVALENVIVTVGAKHAIWMTLFALLNPGDEVILLAPYWVSYPEMVRMAQGIPVVIQPEEGLFVPSLKAIELAITPATKAVIVNSPNNPSGAIYPAHFVAELVELCEQRGIYYISDDIYHKLVFDGKSVPNPYSFTNKDMDSSNIVVVNGISKLYGMTGFRIGWVVASRHLIALIRRIQSQTVTTPPALSQIAAEAALRGDQETVERLRSEMQHHRDIALQELRALSGVNIIPPEGAFYLFPDFRAYSDNSLELARFLLEKAFVVTVPGREFGMEGYLRLSYSASIEEIIEGITRIRWALDPNAPREIYIGDRKMVRDWL